MVSYILLCSSYINVEHIAVIQIFVINQFILLFCRLMLMFSILFVCLHLCCVVMLLVLGSSVLVKG